LVATFLEVLLKRDRGFDAEALVDQLVVDLVHLFFRQRPVFPSNGGSF